MVRRAAWLTGLIGFAEVSTLDDEEDDRPVDLCGIVWNRPTAPPAGDVAQPNTVDGLGRARRKPAMTATCLLAAAEDRSY
jgi:hypothetical protein